MSIVLSRPANGSPDAFFSVRGRPCHRKRSSSLCALAELCLPSPPLSPSISINFAKDTNVTGEIPIIFEFLTTSSIPSEERISKMASLKPELPALARFSPMSAFFPMSDSSGTLNTISTEAFGTRRRASCYSDTSQRRCSVLSDGSVVYSPLSIDFGLPSPTEAVGNQENSNSEAPMPSSVSMPSVRVQDYDVGQKKLGDISNFSISAYLDSPSTTSLKSLKARTRSEEVDSLPVSSQGLLLAPTTPDVDDKTPTQSTFFRRQPLDQEKSTARQSVSSTSTDSKYIYTMTFPGSNSSVGEEPSPTCGNSSLTVPLSPDDDDKTPTQTTFLKHQPNVNKEPVTTHLVATVHASSALGSALTVPFSPDSDDKTPTQSTFLKRQPQSPTKCITRVGASSESQMYVAGEGIVAQQFEPKPGEKPLPAEPTETKTGSPADYDDVSYFNYIPRNPLPVPCLKHAQWLRDTIVELWIDQEGFRAIRPKFFLASVSNGLPYSQDPSYGPFPSGTIELTEDHDPLYTTVAEFLPVSRAAHYFHHAAFDRAPTLHRITTGDETKDHISRAATIGLRENGVFFVHGTEDHRIDGDRPLSFISTSSTSSHSHPNATANGGGSGPASGGRIIRLNWRFEYFVSSRRPDGRSAHRGEKIITPLSFSCTPALLHPSHAYKVTVFHIMKKTLMPNLVAQKLEIPDLPMPMLTAEQILQTRTCASMSARSLASLISANEEYGHNLSRNNKPNPKVISPTKTVFSQNRRRSGSTSTSISEQGILPIGAPASISFASPVKGSTTTKASGTGTATKTPFVPPRLKTPPRPPLPYTKHRRGSHSDTTPEYMRQRNDASGSRVAGNTHERSRSACSFGRGSGTRGSSSHHQPSSFSSRNQNSSLTSRGSGRGGGLAGGIFGPIIPQKELMKMLDKSEARTTTAFTNTEAGVRRPHSIRVEVVDNVQVTTLPAPPRHKHHP
ncbi:hypothetical protein ACEPAI_217 [Sanghuangporus weigelae]